MSGTLSQYIWLFFNYHHYSIYSPRAIVKPDLWKLHWSRVWLTQYLVKHCTRDSIIPRQRYWPMGPFRPTLTRINLINRINSPWILFISRSQDQSHTSYKKVYWLLPFHKVHSWSSFFRLQNSQFSWPSSPFLSLTSPDSSNFFITAWIPHPE